MYEGTNRYWKQIRIKPKICVFDLEVKRIFFLKIEKLIWQVYVVMCKVKILIKWKQKKIYTSKLWQVQKDTYNNLKLEKL